MKNQNEGHKYSFTIWDRDLVQCPRCLFLSFSFATNKCPNCGNISPANAQRLGSLSQPAAKVSE